MAGRVVNVNKSDGKEMSGLVGWWVFIETGLIKLVIYD